MTDYIDKKALIEALEKVRGPADEWISLVGDLHCRVRDGEFDAKPEQENNCIVISCKECQMIEDLKQRVERLEKSYSRCIVRSDHPCTLPKGEKCPAGWDKDVRLCRYWL